MARITKKGAEETRTAILETALDVFSRKGFSHTSFDEIARQINLSKGAVYWHFKTKTDLLVALIEYSCERRNAHLERLEDQSDSLNRLRWCFIESLRLLLTEPMLRKFEFFIYFQIEWSEALMQEVHDRLSELRTNPIRIYRSALERLQENGHIDVTPDAEALATLLIAAGTGLLRLALIRQLTVNQVTAMAEHQFDTLFGKYPTQEKTP